jgi:hypothetical protein
MAKNYLSIIAIFAFFLANAQNPTSAERILKNAVGFGSMVSASAQTISSQIYNWEMKKTAEPNNAMAWLNYYIWTERDRLMPGQEKKIKLMEIVSEAYNHISNSSEYQFMLFMQSGKTDSSSLNKALSWNTDKTWIYPYAIHYAIIKGEKKLLANYVDSLVAAGYTLSKEEYEYHSNVLMSAEDNAVIYARGINDLVPLAVLQHAHGIRKDIRLKYYQDKIDEKNKVYLCLSLGKEALSGYPNAHYTGLLVKISGPNDIHELEQHIQQDFNFSHLQSTASVTAKLPELYKNYLPGLILLYKYYKANQYLGAVDLKGLMENIAQKTGVINEMEKVLKEE